MNLFKNELFNATMLQALSAREPRSYRMPAFARRYGRRRDADTSEPAPALIAYAIERIGDELVMRQYDQAA
jgi:hypothetical protein